MIKTEKVLLIFGIIVFLLSVNTLEIQAEVPHVDPNNEFAICTAPKTQDSADIWDHVVVWRDYRHNTPPIIMGCDLNTHEEFVVGTHTFGQSCPDIYENTVIFHDYRGSSSTGLPSLYGYDIVSKNEFLIKSYVACCNRPAIYGNNVIFLADQKVYCKTLQGSEMILSDSYSTTAGFSPVATWDNLAIWCDDPSGNSDIFGRYLSEDEMFPIVNNFNDQRDIALWQDVVVWIQDGALYGKKIGQSEFLISEYPCSNPAVHNNIVVYSKFPDIYGYDLGSGTEFPICTASGTQSAPEIYGNIVIWQDSRNDATTQTDIYGNIILGTGTPLKVCADKILGDLNNDCRIDLVDIAMICSHWLECNLVPEDACWD